MPTTVSRGATLFAVGVVHFLIPFMMSAVGVALPAIGREMKASALELGWVATSYPLAESCPIALLGGDSRVVDGSPGALHSAGHEMGPRGPAAYFRAGGRNYPEVPRGDR